MRSLLRMSMGMRSGRVVRESVILGVVVVGSGERGGADEVRRLRINFDYFTRNEKFFTGRSAS
jgi:hypothetical protein